mgnify:CR=1 FL=1
MKSCKDVFWRSASETERSRTAWKNSTTGVGSIDIESRPDSTCSYNGDKRNGTVLRYELK